MVTPFMPMVPKLGNWFFGNNWIFFLYHSFSIFYVYFIQFQNLILIKGIKHCIIYIAVTIKQRKRGESDINGLNSNKLK